MVEENKHYREEPETSRLRAAKFSTSVICSRDKSNHSMMSLIEAPASRFSKTVATGMRVPRKTQAPLTLPGTLSTAGHCDQSSAIKISPETLPTILVGFGPEQREKRPDKSTRLIFLIILQCPILRV